MTDGQAVCGTEVFTRFVGMDCTGGRAVSGDLVWCQRGQVLHSVMPSRWQLSAHLFARATQHVPAAETERRRRHVFTDTAVVSLVQKTVSLHQRRHGQVCRKAVSNVLQAFASPLLWFHDGAAAERTLCLSLWFQPGQQTVATHEMSAWEQFGFSELFMTHAAFLFVGLLRNWSRRHCLRRLHPLVRNLKWTAIVHNAIWNMLNEND